jgi:hypothetical protein
MAFSRTDKRRGARAREGWPIAEALLSAVLLAVALGLAWDCWVGATAGRLGASRALLALWLAFYGAAFGAAPWYAFRSRVSAWAAARAEEGVPAEP